MRELTFTIKYVAIGLLFAAILSCDMNSSETREIDESLYPVEELTLLPGGENASIIVNRGVDSYLLVKLENINNTEFDQLGILEAWCIDFRKPLDLSNGVYKGIKIYSTFGVEKWAKLNYLLNNIDELRDNDPAITFREIQIAIWTLRSNPEFDINDISLADLPAILLEDGRANFNYLRVEKILDHVEMNYSNFEFAAGTKYALILETPADVQTIFAVVD